MKEVYPSSCQTFPQKELEDYLFTKDSSHKKADLRELVVCATKKAQPGSRSQRDWVRTAQVVSKRGRIGYFLKNGTTSIRVPNDLDAKVISLEKAIELIEIKKQKDLEKKGKKKKKK